MHWSGSKALGDYGERRLAPALLKLIGLEEVVDLNQHVHLNFPWADFYGKKDGRYWMVAVRTRSRREKAGGLNLCYNSANGLVNVQKAFRLLQQHGFAACDLMWLSIAMEIDQTYEAYWGYGREMRHFMEPNIYWGIPMDKESTARYRHANRMVADGKPHDFDWLLYKDNWTYEEHQKWRINKKSLI